jgi:hypothetical protein
MSTQKLIAVFVKTRTKFLWIIDANDDSRHVEKTYFFYGSLSYLNPCHLIQLKEKKQ